MEENEKRIFALVALLAKSIEKHMLMFITGLNETDTNEALKLLSEKKKLTMYAFEDGQYVVTKKPEECIAITGSRINNFEDVLS